MPESSIHIVPRDGTCVLSDGAGHSLTLTYINGDFKWTPGKYSVSHIMPRGIIQSPPMIRKDQDQIVTGSFTATLTDLSDAAYATLCEIIHQSGYFASTWVSTAGALCDAKTVAMAFTISKAGETHSSTFAYAYLHGDVTMGTPAAQLSVTFEDYEAAPTLV